MLVSWILPPTSMKVRVGPLTMMSAMSSRASSGSSGPKPEHVVADVVEQILLLGDRQHQILDRHDFVDDVADFLARAFLVELGQRRQIDRLDQRAEDHRLGLKIALRPPNMLAFHSLPRLRERSPQAEKASPIGPPALTPSCDRTGDQRNGSRQRRAWPCVRPIRPAMRGISSDSAEDLGGFSLRLDLGDHLPVVGRRRRTTWRRAAMTRSARSRSSWRSRRPAISGRLGMPTPFSTSRGG
jgi:hypothetical protein